MAGGSLRSTTRRPRPRLCLKPARMPTSIGPRRPRACKIRSSGVAGLLRKHRLIEGLVPRTSRGPGRGKPPRSSRNQPSSRRAGAALTDELDRLHPGRHRVHPRGAATRRAALHLGPGPGCRAAGTSCLKSPTAVRESLISSMDTDELVAATEKLEADEIAELAPDLSAGGDGRRIPEPADRGARAVARGDCRSTRTMVGALMDFEDITVRPDVTLEVVVCAICAASTSCRRKTDQVFVVDRDERLLAVLPINTLIVNDPGTTVEAIMQQPVVKLRQHEEKPTLPPPHSSGTTSYRRPVVDTHDRLVGARDRRRGARLRTAKRRGKTLLAQAGLREEEDVFASVWGVVSQTAGRGSRSISSLRSSRSRVIGVFEGSIEKLVALARADADRRRHRRQFG